LDFKFHDIKYSNSFQESLIIGKPYTNTMLYNETILLIFRIMLIYVSFLFISHVLGDIIISLAKYDTNYKILLSL